MQMYIRQDTGESGWLTEIQGPPAYWTIMSPKVGTAILNDAWVINLRKTKGNYMCVRDKDNLEIIKKKSELSIAELTPFRDDVIEKITVCSKRLAEVQDEIDAAQGLLEWAEGKLAKLKNDET